MRPAGSAFALLLALSGCASSPNETPDSAPTQAVESASSPGAALNESAFDGLEPTTDRAFISGSVAHVAIPLGAIDGAPDPDSLAPASIVRLTRDAIADPNAWLRAHAWRSAADDEPAAATLLLIPRDALADRESLTVGGRTVDLVRVDRAAAGPSVSLTGAFQQFSAPLGDASMRWRARLALESHGVDASSLGVFEDAGVEAFASALELRALGVLQRLGAHDAPLAERLRTMLGRTLTFPDGVIAPAWPAADSEVEDIFRVTLDPTVPDVAAGDRARQWLDAQVRAVAWVADDAGPLGVRIHVAELAGKADLLSARVAPSETCDPATLLALLPRTVAEVDLRCRRAPARREIRVSVGDWSDSLEALAGPVEVSPPGVRAGPFSLPHSMRTMLAGQVGLPDSAYATAALIRRKPARDDWEVYAECLAPSPEHDDTLRIYFGSADAPREVIEVRANGEAVRTRFDGSGDSTASEASVTVRRLDDRWVCFMDVPQGAFEPDGALIVGAERLDPRGVRSVWPRPVLPWEALPARLAIDPASWAPLGRTGER